MGTHSKRHRRALLLSTTTYVFVEKYEKNSILLDWKNHLIKGYIYIYIYIYIYRERERERERERLFSVKLFTDGKLKVRY